MPVSVGRSTRLRWLQIAAGVGAIVVSVLLIALGIIGYGESTHASSIWMIVCGAFVLFFALMWMTLLPIVLKLESNLTRQLGVLRDLRETFIKQSSVLDSIAENTHISDAAKSLAHRTQELEALRTAIREDHRNGNWEAALNLIEEMERRFGNKEEADRFREELDDARNEAIEAKLHEAIEMVESHFQSYDWVRAQAVIDRLLGALPDHSKVVALQDRMAELKEKHKGELMKSWDEAVRRHDTDHAVDILKELDPYLSRAEAQALRSSARDVFKEKLLQLGVQFRFAVTEKRWEDAVGTGLELIREFPNSRMANEVREAMDALRERARVTEGEVTGVPEVPTS